MCDIKPPICMTSYEFHISSQPLFMISQDSIHNITSTLFLTSHPLYMTWHSLFLWHHTHCNYEKTPTMFLTLYSKYMTSHMVNEWQHIDCIWHDTQCICIIQTNLIDDITPYVRMKSHPLHAWNQRNFISIIKDPFISPWDQTNIQGSLYSTPAKGHSVNTSRARPWADYNNA